MNDSSALVTWSQTKICYSENIPSKKRVILLQILPFSPVTKQILTALCMTAIFLQHPVYFSIHSKFQCTQKNTPLHITLSNPKSVGEE